MSTRDTARSFGEISHALGEIGESVIAPAAQHVDRNASFPAASIDALRERELIGAAAPIDIGGLGLTLRQLVGLAEQIGSYCGATGMIWAMHQIQLACLVRHGSDSDALRGLIAEAVSRQWLIASATSEVGVGGDIRRSIACLRERGEAVELEKEAATISYGGQADAFLVTARRSPEANEGDQALVLVTDEQTVLEATSVWDTLGMRGTCSPGFLLRASFSPGQIVSMPFAVVASGTMVPYSHLLWSGCWLGIATDAVDRARRYARRRARSDQLGSATAEHLAQAGSALGKVRGVHESGLSAFEAASRSDVAEVEDSLRLALELNNVKLVASVECVHAVEQALAVAGMAGYSESSPFSVARHLRDLYSARLMISNDRLLETNGQLMLAGGPKR
jgi:acyl-CoA dehydrogenase